MTSEAKYIEEMMNLADELAKDILNATDQELIEEFDDEGLDLDDVANATKAVFESCCSDIGIEKLNKAQRELKKNKANQPVLKPMIDPAYARSRIKQVFDNNKIENQFTMAARNADELSDADIVGLYNRMLRLNIISNDSNGDSND